MKIFDYVSAIRCWAILRGVLVGNFHLPPGYTKLVRAALRRCGRVFVKHGFPG